jgi:hypothetical protein
MAGYLNDDLEDLEDDYVDFDGFGVSGSSGGDPSNPVCMVNTFSIIKAQRAFCCVSTESYGLSSDFRCKAPSALNKVN